MSCPSVNIRKRIRNFELEIIICNLFITKAREYDNLLLFMCYFNSGSNHLGKMSYYFFISMWCRIVTHAQVLFFYFFIWNFGKFQLRDFDIFVGFPVQHNIQNMHSLQCTTNMIIVKHCEGYSGFSVARTLISWNSKNEV